MMEIIVPDWPLSGGIGALTSTRNGGVSIDAWRSLNLGSGCGDESAHVLENRRRLRSLLPDSPKWLAQVHGNRVIEHDGNPDGLETADAIVSSRPGQVCAVLTADCLPVLFADRHGQQVAAAHAGWRGMASGVLENTLLAMSAPPRDIMAWLGPGIGPDQYEVGDDVRDAFVSISAIAGQAFRRIADRWLADLYLLARQRLEQAGVRSICGGEYCTFSDAGRFFSYRRDGVTGRMASLVWLR